MDLTRVLRTVPRYRRRESGERDPKVPHEKTRASPLRLITAN